MRPLRAWIIRLAGVFRRRSDFDAELESHLHLHIDDGVRAGLTPADARRQALLKLGGIEPARQSYHARFTVRCVENLEQDIRYGLRAIRCSGSWLAIVMLGVAIGMSTAMFAMLDALVLRPVPFPHADRVAFVAMWDERGTRPTRWPIVDAWRREAPFEAIGSVTHGTTLLGTDNGPAVVPTAYVTAGMFDLLGVAPIRGREFNEVEAGQGGGGVIISADLWRRAFASDPGVVGRTVQVDRAAAVVVGVMPSGFRFPEWNIEVWRPLDHAVRLRDTWPSTYARFPASVPRADSLRMAAGIAHQVDSATIGQHVEARAVAGDFISEYADRALPLIAGGVGLVFLTLCANAGGLLLARFNSRRRQFGLCAALGASRQRILGQALVETGVLGLAGGVLGVLLAWQLVALARRLLPRSLLEQSLHPLGVDAAVLAAAIGAVLVATLVAGLLPAWVATRLDVSGALRPVERGGTETRGARVLTRALLVSEVALACTLLIGAALLVRSFVNLSSIDRGFDSRNVTTAQVGVDNILVSDRAARRTLLTEADAALKRLPGVAQVAWSQGAPTSAAALQFGDDWLSDVPGARPVNLVVDVMYVNRDFFTLYAIDILSGRGVEPADAPSGVVVDERMADVLWPGLNPVGRSFLSGTTRFDVVGLARTTRRLMIDRRRDHPTFYQAFEPQNARIATASLRCAGPCPAEGVIRKQMFDVGRAIVVQSVSNIDDVYDQDVSEPRMTASLAAVFSTIALVAAAGGLFSVLSYAVGRRRREFGIRSALGASAGSIAALVLREGLVVAMSGLILGSIGAWFLARALQSVQYGVSASDPLIWTTVLGLLAATTLAATWRPVRAAMRVNPVILLKEE